jgi:hypothetical protein
MAHRSLLRLAPRLQRQHGVLTVSQAEQDGVDRRSLRELRRAGLLRPTQLHVLRCVLTPVTWESRAMEVQLAAGPAASLGRWSAARLHELVRPGTRAPSSTSSSPGRGTAAR